MAIQELPALHKSLVSRDNPDQLRQLRDTSAADATLAKDRASVELLEPVRLNNRSLVKLRVFFVGTAKTATIAILAAPKGGGPAEILWIGAVSSGAALPALKHPITGEVDAASWHEVDITTVTFSKGPEVVDENPFAAGEVAGYGKSWKVVTDGAELLAVHIASPSARCIVGIEAF